MPGPRSTASSVTLFENELGDPQPEEADSDSEVPVYSSIEDVRSVTTASATASVSERRSSTSGSNAPNSPDLSRGGPRRADTGLGTLRSVVEEGSDADESSSQWSHDDNGQGGDCGVELGEMRPVGSSRIDAAEGAEDPQGGNEGEEGTDDSAAEASEAAEVQVQDDHESGCGCGCNIL